MHKRMQYITYLIINGAHASVIKHDENFGNDKSIRNKSKVL